MNGACEGDERLSDELEAFFFQRLALLEDFLSFLTVGDLLLREIVLRLHDVVLSERQLGLFLLLILLRARLLDRVIWCVELKVFALNAGVVHSGDCAFFLVQQSFELVGGELERCVCGLERQLHFLRSAVFARWIEPIDVRAELGDDLLDGLALAGNHVRVLLGYVAHGLKLCALRRVIGGEDRLFLELGLPSFGVGEVSVGVRLEKIVVLLHEGELVRADLVA